jgi:tetratricopeptide (TPR) repeat protein
MRAQILGAAALALLAAACGPKIEPRPIMQNGGIIQERSDETVARARALGDAERARLASESAEATGAALAGCRPPACDAVLRGTLALGMTEAQALAATRTTGDAWDRRASERTVVLTATGTGARAPADAAGQLAMVVIHDGVVQSYTYREPQGLRVVVSPADATRAGRLAVQADALLDQGDDFALRGDFDGALNRYDRADLLRPNHPETTLRIATALDKQLRPVEALIRYRLFLHQLELERIGAYGDAYAKLADAIAQARQRVIILERQTR